MQMGATGSGGSVPYYDFNLTKQSLNLTLSQLKDAVNDLSNTFRMTYGQVVSAGKQQIMAPVLQKSFNYAQQYLQSPLPVQKPVYTTPGMLPAIGAPLAAGGWLKAKGTSYLESGYYGGADITMRALQLSAIPLDFYNKLVAPLADIMAWNSGYYMPLAIPAVYALNYMTGQTGEALKLSSRLGHMTIQRGARIAPMMLSNSGIGYGLKTHEAFQIGPELQRELFDIAKPKEIEKLYTVATAYGYLDFAGTKEEIKRRMHKLVQHYKEAQSTLRVSLEEYVSLMRDLRLNQASDARISQVFNEIRTTAFATGQSPQQAAGVALMGEQLFRRYTWGNRPGTGANLMSYFTFQNAPGMNLTPQGAHWVATHGGPNAAGAQQMQSLFQFINTPLGATLMANALTPSGAFDAQKLMEILQNPERWTKGGSTEATKEKVMQTISKIRSGDVRFKNAEALRQLPYAMMLGAIKLTPGGNPYAVQSYLQYRGQFTGAVPDLWFTYNKVYYDTLKQLRSRGMEEAEAAQRASQIAMSQLENMMKMQDITFHAQTIGQAYSQVSPWGKIPVLWHVPQKIHWAKRQLATAGSYLGETATAVSEIPGDIFKHIHGIAERHALKDIVEGNWNRNRTLRRFMEQNALRDLHYWTEQKKTNEDWYNKFYQFTGELAKAQGIEWKEGELTAGQSVYMSIEAAKFTPLLNEYRKLLMGNPTSEQIAAFEEKMGKALEQEGISGKEAGEILRKWFPIRERAIIKSAAKNVMALAKSPTGIYRGNISSGKGQEQTKEAMRETKLGRLEELNPIAPRESLGTGPEESKLGVSPVPPQSKPKSPGGAMKQAPPPKDLLPGFNLVKKLYGEVASGVGAQSGIGTKEAANRLLYAEVVKLMNDKTYGEGWRNLLQNQIDQDKKRVKNIKKTMDIIKKNAELINPREFEFINTYANISQGKYSPETLLTTGSAKGGFSKVAPNVYRFTLGGQISQGGISDTKSVEEAISDLQTALTNFANSIKNETEK